MELIETDKQGSGLLYYYEKKLQQYKGVEDLKVAEFGIWYGGFLQWMDIYFEGKAKIYGMDGKLEHCKFNKSELFLVSQDDKPSLNTIANQIGMLDVFVEDGAHEFSAAWNTFHAFWPFIKPGGVYFIEDWGAHYYANFQQVWQDRFKSMTKLTQYIVEHIPEIAPAELEIYYRSSGCSVIMLRK